MLIGGGDPHGPSCICMHVSHDHSRGEQLTRTSLPRILMSSMHATMPCHALPLSLSLSLSVTCECCVIDSLVDGQDIKKKLITMEKRERKIVRTFKCFSFSIAFLSLSCMMHICYSSMHLRSTGILK
jgi:hypothetical protein